MALTGYPYLIHPGQQRFIFSQEDASYGTPSQTAGKTFLEACNSITSAIQRQPYEANEYVGVPASLFDMIETTHHTTVTISVPWRSNGFSAWALAAIMGSTLGGSSDTSGVPSGTNFTNPQTGYGTAAGQNGHYIVANNANNICNTFTIYHDTGDAGGNSTAFPGVRGLLQIPNCTVESIRFTFTPNTALMCEVTLQGNFPYFRQSGSGSTGIQNGPPSGYIRLGSDNTYKATRMMGFQAQNFNIYQSIVAGSTTAPSKYTNRILSGDLTITRPIEVIESPYSQNPTYFLPGPLTVTGTINALYDGLGDLTGTYAAQVGNSYNTDAIKSTTVYQDYLNFKRMGTSTTPNVIQYIDTDGNGFEVTFYPIKWSSFGLTASSQSLQLNAGFTSFNDLGAAAPQTGISKISSVEHVYIVNNAPTGAMIA